MNLYSQKTDGSVKAVEKETAIAKISKRKAKGKKSDPEPEPEPVVELETIPEVPQEDVTPEDDYEQVLKELEAFSDSESNESVPKDVLIEKEEPVAQPVESKKRKRQPSVSKKSMPPTPSNSPKVDDVDNEPPKWFMNYVSNMKTFQNEVAEKKKTKRVLKTEADDYAKKQWKKPDLRQRVTDNVDSHLTKMYRQIFSNRN
jgi:hypothetical protein